MFILSLMRWRQDQMSCLRSSVVSFLSYQQVRETKLILFADSIWQGQWPSFDAFLTPSPCSRYLEPEVTFLHERMYGYA